MNLFENIIILIFTSFIIYKGALMVGNNEISLGKLITFNYLFSYLFEPLKSILDSLLNLNEIKSSIKRIIDLYYYEEDIKEEKIESGNIEIKNLNFAYNYKNILKNFIGRKEFESYMNNKYLISETTREERKDNRRDRRDNKRDNRRRDSRGNGRGQRPQGSRPQRTENKGN